MSRAHLRRRPESPVRFGASSVASRWTGWGVGLPDDAIHSPNERVVLPMLERGAEAAAHLWSELASPGAHQAGS